MASASALAGAFTSLGASANRAAAKKTNVVAKKVRVPAGARVPNEARAHRRHRFRASRGREDSARARRDLRVQRIRRKYIPMTDR
jgi:hypothetical protein